MKLNPEKQKELSYNEFKEQIISDYKTAFLSRECSLLGRREVLTGKAKFGIFGDGKELPQLAMARAFKPGDFRSGYYRDQTLMMALGLYTPLDLFHGLYATTDISKEPMSAGRQMGGHFVTHSVDQNGEWKNLSQQMNSSADLSPTAAQIPRLLGLAQASKVYRNHQTPNSHLFSNAGNEIAWGTIGNASTSEGCFFETINAAGVLQVPMVISVWDDEYGISVPAKYQTTKSSISEVLAGFQRTEEKDGFEIIKVKGWDYTALIHAYENAADIAREKHVPVLVHVVELTQPQGHSTSGSHERYKSKKRLEWEDEMDCNKQFRSWILQHSIATEEELEGYEKEIKRTVRNSKRQAWNEFLAQHKDLKEELVLKLTEAAKSSTNKVFIEKIKNDLIALEEPIKKDLISKAREAIRFMIGEESDAKNALALWIKDFIANTQPAYSSHLYNETKYRATAVEAIPPQYDADSQMVDGRLIIRDNFDKLLDQHPELLIFGEDCGKIGDVNQGLEGLQEKYGEIRVSDTGIRETTLVGQGVGMALRGLRPIAEIQYLDYILYAIQTLSDDVSSLHYRTFGKQKVPLIIRTRGHRLEGIWHSGSPTGGMVHFLRGMCILSPRNMTVAAGFYNSLLKSDDPAIVIESLNGYRLKEKMPSNLGEYTVPIGVVETLKEGNDITVVSYGSTLRIVGEVAQKLLAVGIDIELIDAQSLVPFDLDHQIVESVKKTNRLVVIDEDVPGGCSAYLLQEILEKEGAYNYLDSKPMTITSQAHRPAYASDGDYFSKPNADEIYEKLYHMMHEADPLSFPSIY